MQGFNTHTGIAAPLDLPNVDTDQIIPKQFLKRIERTGFGQFLFFDWRYLDDESDNPEFELNKPRYSGASVLLARRNFGCGSSREHAPWSLEDYGFKVIIAPSFADIFFNNCFKNSMLPIVLDEDLVEKLFKKCEANEGYKITADLEAQELRDDDGVITTFEVDPFRKHCLLNALDDIGLTLEHEDDISSYEKEHGIIA